MDNQKEKNHEGGAEKLREKGLKLLYFLFHVIILY